jgi:hypothetical protein
MGAGVVVVGTPAAEQHPGQGERGGQRLVQELVVQASTLFNLNCDLLDWKGWPMM